MIKTGTGLSTTSPRPTQQMELTAEVRAHLDKHFDLLSTKDDNASLEERRGHISGNKEK